jgi:hypothetical protein
VWRPLQGCVAEADSSELTSYHFDLHAARNLGKPYEASKKDFCASVMSGVLSDVEQQQTIAEVM